MKFKFFKYFIFALIFNSVLAMGQESNSLVYDSSQDGKNQENSSKRPNCDYNFGASGGHVLLSKFYSELMRDESTGKPMTPNSLLFYIKLEEIGIGALSPELIENRDFSPLNPNWKWPAGKVGRLSLMTTFDGGETWYYLIKYDQDQTRTRYWVSDEGGYLCGNVLSLERGRFTTAYGMSRIFQKRPLEFSNIKIENPNVVSIAVSSLEINGPIAKIQTNININGKSVYSKVESVDFYGGDFEVSKIKFTTQKNGDKYNIQSIQIPANTSKWLHYDLKIRQNFMKLISDQ